MSTAHLLRRVAAAAIAAVAALTVAGPASAATAPVSRAHILVHFDLAAGQMPENIALEPNGNASVTFAGSRQIARISRHGAVRILATLPAPADGGVNTPVLGFPLLTGLVRSHDRTLYFLYAAGSSDLTGVWKLRPGGTPQRIAALPADGLPNGLALDAQTGMLYAADSVLGVIWRVPAGGGTPIAWAGGPELASAGFLGVNGIKVHRGAVWASNLDKGTIVQIPVNCQGLAGPAQTKFTGLAGIDDFAFTGRGDQLLVALIQSSEVVLVESNGSRTVVLTAADGLQNPTSVAVRHNTVYVPSAAYLTQTDPNLLLAHLN